MTSTQKLSVLLAFPVLFLGVEAAVAAPLVTGVVNAASYASGSVAPGEIVALFGSGMGPATLATQQPTDRYGTTLSGVQVTFNGIAAPLLYVSATQIGAVVPYGVSGSASASVQVVYLAAKSNVLAVGMAASALGVFTANAAGTGAGAILNQNYGLNSVTNPAILGDVIMVFGTGEGVTTPAGTDGVLDPNPAPQPASAISATIGGQTAKVWYAGGSPGLVAGLVQVNVQIPASIVACSGTGVPLVLTSAAGSSQTQVTLQIQSATTCPGSAVKSLTFTTT